MCLIVMAAYNAHAQTQTGYRIPPRVDIGGGRMTGDMYLQASTSGVRLYIGTDTVTQVGTSGVITGTIAANLPYLHFRHAGGSTSVNFIGFNQVMVGSTTVSVGDLSLKVNITNGTCTGLAGTNTTFYGTNTISSTSVFSTNGRVLTDIELSYLDGLSDFLTTLLAAKQNDLGGTYCATISDDVGTSTGAIRFGKSGDLTLTKTGNQFVYGFVGSVSSKPSTMEDGGTVTASPVFIDYDGNDFDPVGSGTGSRIKLSVAQKGSSTPTANTVLKAGSTGTISASWLDTGFCYAYRTTSMSGIAVGTWTNIPLDSDLNDSKYGTHSVVTNTDQIIVLVPGMYEVSSQIQSKTAVGAVATRICKNNQVELPGSFAIAYTNYGDGNSGIPISLSPIQVRLVANDYLYMQVTHNIAGSSATCIDYVISGGMPAPGTGTYAHLSVRKIGE